MKNIKIGQEEVQLDPGNLQVNESNLNDFLSKFPGIYSYYNAKWVESQYIQYQTEDYYDEVYCKKFKFFKDGSSDKLAEAQSKADDQVIEAKKEARKAKLNAQLLYGYLRALDKCFECAINLGYNMRREMDKLFPRDIKKSASSSIESQLDQMFDN
jgi:hypothetical protein